MTDSTAESQPGTETTEPSMRADLLGIIAILAASAITYGIAAGI